MGIIPLAPLFLFGTLTAAIPVLIHLLARRESIRVEWPTLRYLKETERRTAQRRRVEQWLLMLLRMLILLLLALGLSRPVMRFAGGAGSDTSVVLILDDTLSSRAAVEGRSSFENARAAGLRVMEGLPENSLCGVVFVSGRDNEAASGLAPGPSGVREALRAASPSFARGDIGRALNKAIELVSSQASGIQEVYLLSDMQANAFPLPGEVNAEAPNALLVLAESTPPSPQNLTLSEVSARPATPVPGSRLTVEAEIVSRASLPMKTAATLFLNGSKRAGQEVQVPPGGRTRAAFELNIDSYGLHEVTVETSEDALNADNRRWDAFFIPKSMNVLVAAPDNLKEEAFHFLRCALDPFSVIGTGPRAIDVKRTGMFPSGSSHSAILVVGKTAAGPGDVFRYLSAGGTVIVMPGPEGLPEWLREVTSVKSGRPRTVNHVPLSFDRKALVNPPFSMLPGLGPGAFRAVELRCLVEVSLPEEDPPGVILKTTDGQPVLLLQKFGDGRLFVFTTGADASWGNLVLRGIFPLMLQQMVYQSALAGGVRSLHAGVGQSVAIPTNTAAVDVTSPSGSVMRLTPVEGSVRLRNLSEPGVYRLNRTSDGGLDAFVTANPDPREGDLRSIPLDEAACRLESSAGTVIQLQRGDDIEKVLLAVRKGIPIYNYLLGLVFVIVIFETFFANRITPHRKKDQSPSAQHLTSRLSS